jgi:glycosyltransferase involved in cell wall biosynthesis
LVLVIRLLAGRAGGAERVYCTLANALNHLGYEVTAAYCEGKADPPAYELSSGVSLVNLWDEPARQRGLLRFCKRQGERRLPFGLNHVFAWVARYGGFVLGLRRLLRRLSPELAISFLPSANTVTLAASLGTSTRVLCTNHNVPKEDYESTKRWDQNPVDRFLRRKLLFRAQALSVLFPSYAAYFGPQYAKKVVAIPNFLEDSFFEPAPDGPRARRVVASGRLSWEKNYETLIDAFAVVCPRFPEVELVIYGEGPERATLEARIGKLGLEHRIRLPGHDPDIRSRLREACTLCHPAHFEGFGLSVAEALSQGVPVVAFEDCPGVKEYVVDGQNGVMVARSGGATALAEGLCQVLENEALRTRLAENAPKSVECFRREVVIARWQQLLARLLDD